MSTQHIEQDDIEALAAILEAERLHHCRARGMCFGLFLFSLVMLVFATATIAFVFVSGRISDGSGSEWLGALQLLTPLSAAVIGFFGSWWAAQNCINSIERTLFAARTGRAKLFAGFLGNLQCADKKKRKLWMEMVASLVT
ncbi:MAG TPA: hypothetical protein VG942_06260 [Hyphomonadaceae bacterium]|nr:hypothetical protein [Hyphomonadaceae bacterium]